MSSSGESIRELEGIADVLHFMHNIQPLPGIDQAEDEFVSGRAQIMEWLERRVRGVVDTSASPQSSDALLEVSDA